MLSYASKIFITNSTFKDCRTISNISNPAYGWGGAFYIHLDSAASISPQNFQMTDLVFNGCKSVVTGHNIHIRSVDISSTGYAISSNNLLSVNNTFNLYTNILYRSYYMGINEFEEYDNHGTNNLIYHHPLFTNSQPQILNNPYYIDAIYGIDDAYCGNDTNKCQTIMFVLTFDGNNFPEFDKDNDFIIFNLMSYTSLEDNIIVNSLSLYGYQVIIQSNNYNPVNSYTKQSIISSSNHNSLFTINDIGHLQLYGIHFDNLDPSETVPLISISTNDDNKIPTLSITDCIFEQDSISYLTTSLLHSIISINGGNVIMTNVQINNYQFDNKKSLILIKSDEISSSGVYRINQIEIINSIFEDIKQSGTGNGTIINAQINTNSLLSIKDSSSFINCISPLNGGAIYLEISEGEVEMNQITMSGCSGLNGGGIYSIIDGTGILTIKDSCSFTNCQSTGGNGGAIYSILKDSITSGGIFIINATDSTQSTFSLCSASQLGGGIYIDIQTGGKSQYDLSGTSYSANNFAPYGKNLFINAVNLRNAVPVGEPTRIKIGAGLDSFEKANLINLMGYDNGNYLIAIPLYYMYTQVDQSIYHIKHTSSIDQGNDNVGCGHLDWPCLTIDYALMQNPSSTQRIIGVINGYEFNEQLTLSSTTYTILIQNSLDPTNNQTTTFISSMKITNNGKFIVNQADIYFKYLNFLIQSGGLSTDYIIQSTLETSSISISNCEIHQEPPSISRGFVQIILGSVSITDFNMVGLTKSGGSIIKQDGGTLLFTRGSIEQIIINSDLIQINSGTTTLNQLIVIAITQNDGSLISYSSSGNLNIDECRFTSITKTITNGNGSVISGVLSSTSGSISITGTASNFSQCTVPNDSGLGGAIYLDILTGGETKYDLTDASYQGGNNALYGNNLFINAINLRSAVPVGDPTRIKIGAGNNEQSQLTNLMGYDNGNTQIAVPLYYMYTQVDQSIYNVKDTVSNGQGNDNIGCGHLDYPCLTIGYAIQQSGSATEKKVGIISEYQLNSVVNVNLEGVYIQRQIDAVTWSSTSDNSIIQVKPQGQFSISSGTILFNEITFKVESGFYLQQKYAIEGITGSAQIEMSKCLMIMASNTEGYQLSRGLIELNIGTLMLTNFEVNNIIILEQSVIKINNGAGTVNIIGSKFKNIQRVGSNGKGGVIEGYLNNNNNGKISVSSSTFENCKVDTNNGLGGGIYLKISNGGESKYDLSGASYSGCNAKYGKSLFIEAYDLKLSIQGNTDGSILGTLTDSSEKSDINQLMGYDNDDLSVAIPLIYVFTPIKNSVYHVKYTSNDDKGNDNRFCGHLSWPCLKIDYIITTLTGSITPKQIGIIDGYILNELITIDQSDKEIQISNQLSALGEVTNIKSIINIEGDGKISLIRGTIQFDKIIFTINQNAMIGYIITGTASSTKVSINNCFMKMLSDTTGYSILTGFVELKGGILNINNIEISDIIISDSPVILIGENAGSIIIDNSQFDNITRTTSDSTTQIGGTIEATIGGSSGQLTIQNTDFIKCISQQSYQAGGISLIIKNQRTVSISQASFIQCESDQGSGIYAQILSGGTLTIEGSCSFVCCKSRLDLGASLYSTVSGTDSKFTLEDGLQFEGYIKDQVGNKQTQFGQGRGAYIELSNNGIIEINEITLNDCKGINGGGIQINSLSAQKQTFNGTQFTNCVADQNGGGLYCIIKSGEIELNQITMSECSGLNGGGIYSSIDGTGKLTIKDSCLFTNCKNSDGNGGGIYIDIDFSTQSQISVQSSTFVSCQALNIINSNIHKGYGSGIFISCINWDNINNGIDLSGSQYIDCESDQGDKGLFVVMNELRELCRFEGQLGKYVRSIDYVDIISDLKILMGYRGSPNQFESATTYIDLKDKICELELYWRELNNAWYISSIREGINRLSCGLINNPCQSVIYTLTLSPSLYSQYDPSSDIATMVLLEDDMIDTVININSDTILGNNIAIQSENGGEGKILSFDNMYKIGSNTESNTLFSISEEKSILRLYQIILDNLLDTTTSPLILLTGNSAHINDAQLHIESCIFTQSGNAPLTELKHNLIQINGGTATIKDVSISNYLFSNGKRVINVETISSLQECQFIMSGTTISKIIQQGNVGGSGIKCTISSGSSIQIQDYCLFEECISESGFGGVLNIALDGGILNMKETTMKKCKALNGGAIYASIISMQEFLISQEVYFEECEAVGDNLLSGRGGAIYINLEQDSPYEFKIGYGVYFKLNQASKFGRDVFVYCKNIDDLNLEQLFLFDIFSSSYDKNNALYGTEYESESLLGRSQLIDYDLLMSMVQYISDIIYLSEDQSISSDSSKCGSIKQPCLTLHYGRTKVITPEWNKDTVPQDNIEDYQRINHTFVIYQGIQISEPFQTESDNVILRGALIEEYPTATDYAQMKFSNQGQIICSDLAQWQQQGLSENKGVNQKITLQFIDFILLAQYELQSIAKVIGNKDSNTKGRNIELKIEDCKVSQETPLSHISYGFLKTIPYLTQQIHISFVDLIADNILLRDTALIDLKYKPEIISLDNILDVEKCIFTNIESSFSSLIPQTGDESKDNYIIYGSVLNIVGQNSMLLPIHISDTTFERCKCNVEMLPTEKRQISVGGAVTFIGRNLHVNLEHVHFTNCQSKVIFIPSSQYSSQNQDLIQQNSSQLTNNSLFNFNNLSNSPNNHHFISQKPIYQINSMLKYQIEISGGIFIGIYQSSSEWIAITTQHISAYVHEHELENQINYHQINNLSRPSINFDICVIKECKTVKSGTSSTIKVLESGGVILRSEKSQTRYNLHSSIFIDCIISNQTSPSSSSNLAPSISDTFLPLWLREKEIQIEGSGLIIAYGRTIPTIKADGIQFIGCDSRILDIYSSSSLEQNTNSFQQQQSIFLESKQQIHKSKQNNSKNEINQQTQINSIPPPSLDISHLFTRFNSDIKISHQTINLKAGRFSSQSIQLQEQELTLNGQGENETSIIQKNTSQILLIVENSQLNSFGLAVELWGAKASLIRSQGNGMSLINGIRVNGRKLEGSFVQGSIFEVISGSLSLIDIKIKDVNIIENKQEIISENKRRMKMKGLIEMKEDGQLLYIEKFFIKNINVEQSENNNRWSSIMMNVGHLKLRDSTFLGEAYTSIGSAIRAYPTGPSTIDVEGVLFKGLNAGSNLNGGAIYVNMRVFDVLISFKRCIFIGNKADYGSNVFISYAQPSQRINRNSFIGCTSIVENSYESDLSVCYSIGDNDDKIFIDERDLIHSSWNRQKSEGVVRFISNSDSDNPFDPNIECGSVLNPCQTFSQLSKFMKTSPESIDGSTQRTETIIFGEGIFTSSLMDLSLTHSSIVNIVGCGENQTDLKSQPNIQNVMILSQFGQNIVIERLSLIMSPSASKMGFIRTSGAEAGVVIQDVRVQGYLETDPIKTVLEPQFLFQIEGFIHLYDVLLEHIYLRSGSILQVIGLRRTEGDNRMEWLGKTSIGIYSCIFDDITSNETSLITLHEKNLAINQTSNEINSKQLQNNAKTIKFIISDTIFSNCISSLYINSSYKGGLININTKKVRIEILNSEFCNISMKSKNMIYLGWGIQDPIGINIQTLTIKETLFINCIAVIPNMKAKIESYQQQNEQQQLYQSETEQNFNTISNELYSDDAEIYDSLTNHGLINVYNLNLRNIDTINAGQIEISGIFVQKCHSAVGSVITVNRFTLDLSESIFQETLCFGNMIYLNQTLSTIRDCYFKGYNDSFIDISSISGSDEEIEQSNELCPINPNFFSSAIHALVYIYKGSYTSENNQFVLTRIGAIKLDSSNIVLKNDSFIDPWELQTQLDGSDIMIACIGDSKLNIINPTVNHLTEEQCSSMNQQQSVLQSRLYNENENECLFGIVFDDKCQMFLQNAWNIPEIPIPTVISSKVIVNINKKQEKMKFSIEGDQLVLALFTVQIIEERNKTENEIRSELYENKYLREKYVEGSNNNNKQDVSKNSRKENGFINYIKNKLRMNPYNQQLFLHNNNNITLNTNQQYSNDEDLIRDKRGYIIWPIEGSTQLPIYARGIVRKINYAIFSMNDFSWLDSRKKWYSILVSNDGKHYYGSNGQLNQAVRLDVVIEEGEQFLNYVRFELSNYKAWLISPFIVGILTILISALVYKYWNKKDRQKKEVLQFVKLSVTLYKQKMLQYKDIKKRLANDELIFRNAIEHSKDYIDKQSHNIQIEQTQGLILFTSIRKNKFSAIIPKSQISNINNSQLPIISTSQQNTTKNEDKQFTDMMKFLNQASQPLQTSNTSEQQIPTIQSDISNVKQSSISMPLFQTSSQPLRINQQTNDIKPIESFTDLLKITSTVSQQSSSSVQYQSSSSQIQTSSQSQTNKSTQSASSQSISKFTSIPIQSKSFLNQHFDSLERKITQLECLQQQQKDHPQQIISEYQSSTEQKSNIIADTNVDTNLQNSNLKTDNQNSISTIKRKNHSIIKPTSKTHKFNYKSSQWSDFLSNNDEVPSIDFSLMPSDAIELQNVVWGPSGAPVTLGLSQYGIYAPTSDILKLQERQDKISQIFEQRNDQQRNIGNYQQQQKIQLELQQEKANLIDKELLEQTQNKNEKKAEQYSQEQNRNNIYQIQNQNPKLNQYKIIYPEKSLSPVEEEDII